jgi:hypothetical protein
MIRNLYVLLCLLLPTLLVGQQSTDPDRWESAMQSFEAEDRENFPEPGSVLFIGSSSIKRWETVKDDMAPLSVIHRGFGGSQMVDVIQYFDRIVLPYKPADIVLYEGDNDIGQGKSPHRVLSDFRVFVSMIKAQLPQTRIHFIAIKPSVKRLALLEEMRMVNMMIEVYCNGDDRMNFIDIWNPVVDEEGKPHPELFVEDMLHLNADGYAIWADIIKAHLLAARAGN